VNLANFIPQVCPLQIPNAKGHFGEKIANTENQMNRINTLSGRSSDLLTVQQKKEGGNNLNLFSTKI
jgi:RNA binding exosome subunit